jgi:hypothetical protein
MIVQHITYSISIVFISFVVGMILTSLISKTNIYKTTLSNLNFINSDFINKIIGVEIVQWIVKNTFFRYLNPNLKFNRKMSTSEIRVIRNNMSKSEIDHLFAFLFVSLFMFKAMYNNEILLASVMLIANIMMNLNPSLLQQMNKRRVDKLLSIYDRPK